MKKMVAVIGTLIGCLVVLVGAKRFFVRKSEARYMIGIVQTASHPALDAVLHGFIAELEHDCGTAVAYEIYNAQGSVTTAHTLAQQLASNKQFDLFFTIATPATQALALVEPVRPIVIAAVTDPAALGLDKAKNITGVKDMIDIQKEIDLIEQMVPQAKTIGIVYTQGEVNAVGMAALMRDEIIRRGLRAVPFAFSSETDVPAMVELASRKADVLLAPIDNTVACSISFIAARAAHYKKPLFVSDTMLVQQGAVAARGVDYTQIGRQAAARACDLLLRGKTPQSLPIELPSRTTIAINKKVVDELGLVIPPALQEESPLFVS
jgi:putative tryptophan/tyrosine transport system substrate-binding protein